MLNGKVWNPPQPPKIVSYHFFPLVSPCDIMVMHTWQFCVEIKDYSSFSLLTSPSPHLPLSSPPLTSPHLPLPPPSLSRLQRTSLSKVSLLLYPVKQLSSLHTAHQGEGTQDLKSNLPLHSPIHSTFSQPQPLLSPALPPLSPPPYMYHSITTSKLWHPP